MNCPLTPIEVEGSVIESSKDNGQEASMLSKTHTELQQLVNEVHEEAKRKSSMMFSSMTNHQSGAPEQPSMITDN